MPSAQDFLMAAFMLVCCGGIALSLCYLIVGMFCRNIVFMVNCNAELGMRLQAVIDEYKQSLAQDGGK